MKFIQPKNLEQWKTIAGLLNLPKNLKCYFCNCKVFLGKNSSILPSLKKSKKNYVIACDSPLCISRYLVEQERKEAKK